MQYGVILVCLQIAIQIIKIIVNFKECVACL